MDFLQLIQTSRWIFYGLVTVRSRKTSEKKCKCKTAHWLEGVGNMIANTCKLCWNDEMRQNTISLCHAMHPDKTSSQQKKVCWTMKLEPKCNKRGFRQTLRVQSQTITLYWTSETKSISTFLLLSEQQRATTKRSRCFDFWMITEGWGAFIKKEGGVLLTPGTTITLTTGMAADLKPKA